MSKPYPSTLKEPELTEKQNKCRHLMQYVELLVDKKHWQICSSCKRRVFVR